MTRLDFIKSRLVSQPPAGLRALAYGCAMVAVPTALRALVDPIVSGLAFVTYFPFVMLSALLMSGRQATLVTIGCAAAANFLFMEPRFTFLATPTDTFGTFIFLLSSAFLVAVGQTLRRTVQQLDQVRQRESHLNLELQHRVKNTLAVVQGLAAQTFRDVSDISTPLAKFHGRIRALADANDILRDGQWEECRLPALAVRALEPFNEVGGVSLCGPECSLPEESCVPLVLALHELATNAVKYGALSTIDGSVELTWELSEGDTGELCLRWREMDGPTVVQPNRRGLGSRLLRPQPGLDGVSLSFPSNGVSCDLQIKKAKLLTPGERIIPASPSPIVYSTAQNPAQ
jgi:two-component sensor histidine kinase